MLDQTGISNNQPPVSQDLIDRTSLAFLHEFLENPESIPRSVFRSQGFAVSPEAIPISKEQREIVVNRLARVAVTLEGRLPAKVVHRINVVPTEKPKQ